MLNAYVKNSKMYLKYFAWATQVEKIYLQTSRNYLHRAHASLAYAVRYGQKYEHMYMELFALAHEVEKNIHNIL